MMRLLAIAAALIVLLAIVFADRRVTLRATADETPAAHQHSGFLINSASGLLAEASEARFLGARSCAASACHGGFDPDPRFPLSRRNEFITWHDKDPHSRAYRTLAADASTKILQRLNIVDADGQILDPAGMANCFGCHNPQPSSDRQEESFFVRDGVSCEICHGAAENWIGPHVSDAWTEFKQSGSATALGFIDTEDPLIRARTCAQCHVGSPGREVNHDLLAAGHPPLKFELTAYHDMLPKHWRDALERAGKPELEYELWTKGQQASVEAALALLDWRAARVAGDVPGAIWPEFAEYDCFACHHDLVHPSWRQQSPPQDRPLGMAAWGSWYYSMLRRTANTSFEPLDAQMQRGFAADPKAVQSAISAAQVDTSEFDTLVRQLDLSFPPAPASWDEATQLYLALVATEQAHRDHAHVADETVDSAIAALRGRLAFPSGFDSPRNLFTANSSQVSRSAIEQALADLLQQLKQRQRD